MIVWYDCLRRLNRPHGVFGVSRAVNAERALELAQHVAQRGFVSPSGSTWMVPGTCE